MFESIVELLRENEIMQGGAVLLVWGAILAYCRNIPRYIWDLICRQMIIKVDIPDSELVFGWINLWLAEHSTLKRSRLLTALVVRGNEVGSASLKKSKKTQGTNCRKKTLNIVFSPAPGAHILWYRGRIVYLRRIRRELQNNQNSRAFQETFVIHMLTRNRRLVQEMLKEARSYSIPPEDARIEILEVEYDHWRHMTYRNPRHPESVILPGHVVNDLLKDVQNFLNSRAWYADRSIPYRRGYLLEGPPGAGKTSLVTAIATEMGLDVCVLALSSTTMNDDVLRRLMGDMPASSILLLEDIDAIFKGRNAMSGASKGITFSGLLNAIDGIATKDGRILFMTTNHPEELDPALIRPGRVDRRFPLSWATPEQAEHLFLWFFHDLQESHPGFKHGDTHLKQARAFGMKVAQKQVSMASLQGFLLDYRNDPIGAVRDFEEKSWMELESQHKIDKFKLVSNAE